jgi:hypothetical protein
LTRLWQRIRARLFLLVLRVWGWLARKQAKTTLTLSNDLYAFEVGDTFTWPVDSVEPKNPPQTLVITHIDHESRTITLGGVKSGC